MKVIKKLDNILNFIGACLRWFYGYFFQLALGHENLSFQVFLEGSDDKNDIIGKIGHRNINRILSALVIVPLIMIFIDMMK